jgi:hypothetical protein
VFFYLPELLLDHMDYHFSEANTAMEKRGTGRRNPLGMILDLAFALLSVWSRAAAGQH